MASDALALSSAPIPINPSLMPSTSTPAPSNDPGAPRSLPRDVDASDLRDALAAAQAAQAAAEANHAEEEASSARIRRSLAAYSLGPPTPELERPEEVAMMEPSISPRQTFVVPTHHRTESAPVTAVATLSSLPEGISMPSPTMSESAGTSASYRPRRRPKTAFEPTSDRSEAVDIDPPIRPRHTRRPSLVPGLDLGSAPPLAAPPAARPISVSIRPSSICEDPALPINVYASHHMSRESPASVALARTSSQQSGSSTGFRFPMLMAAPAQPVDIPSASDDRPMMMPPASPLLPPPQSPVKASRGDVDPDAHPLYHLLSRSPVRRVKEAWNNARLVLIPPSVSLPHDFEDWADEMDEGDDHWQEWLTSHAFKPAETAFDPSRETFRSAVGEPAALEVIIDSRSEQVQVGRPVSRPAHIKRAPSDGTHPLNPSITSPHSRTSPIHTASPSLASPLSPALIHPPTYRTLSVLSEMVIYRQRAPKTSLPPILPEPAPPPRKEKNRIRAPKWFRSSSNKTKSSLPPSLEAEEMLPPSPTEEPMLYPVRLLAVSGEVVPWLHSDASSAFDDAIEDDDDEPVQSSSDMHSRSLLEDVAFFTKPPRALATYAGQLADALQLAIALCRDFAGGYLHMLGYEGFTLKRVRTAILDPIWEQHLAMLAHKEASLFQSLENIVMGLLHEQLYTQSILPHCERKNHHLDVILADYRDRAIPLSDFAERLTADIDLRHVYTLLRSLTSIDALSPKAIDADHLNNVIGELDTTYAFMRARTPLDTLIVLRRALSALVEAAESKDDEIAGNRLTTDDLIPLLSYALTMSGVRELESITFYVTNFIQSDLGAEYEWTKSTFSSAVAWLRENPFSADLSALNSASPSPANEMPPSHGVTSSEYRTRHLSSLSVTGGPILSVHMTSSPPRRSSSAASLPHRVYTPPTSSASMSRAHSRLQEATLSPTLDERQSSLYSRRVQSGRHVPNEIAAGIDLRSRSQSVSEGESVGRRSRLSPDEMPPPSYPASSRSAGPSRVASRLSLDTSVVSHDYLDDDTLHSANSGSVILQPPTPDIEIRPQIILRSPAAQRQPSRSYHHGVSDFDAHDLPTSRSTSMSMTARPVRAPLGRANSHIYTGSVGQATDMRRSRSDGQSKRPAPDPWLVSRSPVSEASSSPRSTSPASIEHGVSLERTLSIGSDGTTDDSSYGLTRKRLSSLTSYAPSLDSRRGSQPEKDANGRRRRDSISGSEAASRLSAALSESHSRLALDTRRRSTLSLSSLDSTETTASGSTPASPPTFSPTLAAASSGIYRRRRRHSTRALQRDLVAGSKALAPRVDNFNVLSMSRSSSMHDTLSTHARFASVPGGIPSPIRERATPGPSTEPSPVSERSPILETHRTSPFDSA